MVNSHTKAGLLSVECSIFKLLCLPFFLWVWKLWVWQLSHNCQQQVLFAKGSISWKLPPTFAPFSQLLFKFFGWNLPIDAFENWSLLCSLLFQFLGKKTSSLVRRGFWGMNLFTTDGATSIFIFCYVVFKWEQHVYLQTILQVLRLVFWN